VWATIVALAVTLIAVLLPHPVSELTSHSNSELTIVGVKPGEWLVGIVTWMLWAATSRLVKGADRTAERQLRAYVYLEKTKFNFAGPDRWQISYRNKNFGQTPAHHVRLISIAKVVDWKDGKPAEIPTPNHVETIGSVAPSGDYFEFEEKIEGVASVANLRDGSKAIYLVGTIIYRNARRRRDHPANVLFVLIPHLDAEGQVARNVVQVRVG